MTCPRCGVDEHIACYPTRPYHRRAHGTRAEYINHGCRCDGCRAANNAYKRAWRARRKRTQPAPRPSPPRPWPAAPLLALVANRSRLAALVGASGATMARAVAEGLTDAEADRWALRMGRHPSEVWPSWFDGARLAG